MIGLSKALAAVDPTQVDIPKTSLNADTVPHALQIFFGIAGAVAFLIILIGGFQYTVSRGDPNSIKKAKETIIYAAVGLVVTMLGYGIVTFVLNRL